jgi:hypothetical protein
VRDYEAKTLVAALASFFPWPTPPKGTVAAYEQQFLGLSDVEAATEAVRAASRSSKRWPPWAELYETYRAIVGRTRREAAEIDESPGVFASPEEARKVLTRLDAIPNEEAGPFTGVIRDFMRGVAALPSEGNEAPAEDESELDAPDPEAGPAEGGEAEA